MSVFKADKKFEKFEDVTPELLKKEGVKFYRPSPILCTDNAAMIGAAGYYEYLKGTRSGLDLNAIPNLALGERERKFHANYKKEK